LSAVRRRRGPRLLPICAASVLTRNRGASALVGRRPLTPDGLPILDRVHPFENLYLATGHSMLGITLAPASGKALSDYMMSGKRPAPLEPFRLDRFGNHR